jgi:hypothetical protein
MQNNLKNDFFVKLRFKNSFFYPELEQNNI